jgi:hypothetical protein
MRSESAFFIFLNNFRYQAARIGTPQRQTGIWRNKLPLQVPSPGPPLFHLARRSYVSSAPKRETNSTGSGLPLQSGQARVRAAKEHTTTALMKSAGSTRGSNRRSAGAVPIPTLRAIWAACHTAILEEGLLVQAERSRLGLHAPMVPVVLTFRRRRWIEIRAGGTCSLSEDR